MSNIEQNDSSEKSIKDFSASMPFDLKEMAQSAATLLETNTAAKDVIPTITALGDAVGAMWHWPPRLG